MGKLFGHPTGAVRRATKTPKTIDGLRKALVNAARTADMTGRGRVSKSLERQAHILESLDPVYVQTIDTQTAVTNARKVLLSWMRPSRGRGGK